MLKNDRTKNQIGILEMVEEKSKVSGGEN